MSQVASAFPSKAFFVEMLTRDIELLDAVLDLLDNCIDGAQRQMAAKKSKTDRPYQGFSAELTINKRSFSIVDNCGGIPRDLAEKYAFRLGRPSGMPTDKLPTVGVYGIGMKRAMFKMGRSSKVVTVNKEKAYEVSISEEWIDADDQWELPIKDLSPKAIPSELKAKGGSGTLVTVSSLLPAIAQEFDPQASKFEAELKATIATHYSYIIHKGFAIKVNGTTIKPRALGILVSAPSKSAQRLAPFVYETTQDGVKVDLVVGLYRNIPSQAEVDAELDGRTATGSRETCGWTIVCNDRVVVYNDKTRLTGWGEATVPAYHPQFNAIAGIVRFQSNEMWKLPVTTTKRGLEAGSELFLTVKDLMREGLKAFTNFTNHWKSHARERDELIKSATLTDPFQAISLVDNSSWTRVQKGLGGKKYVPVLPKPPTSREEKSEVTLRFNRPRRDVEMVSDFLFESKDVDPSEVGAQCFDHVLSRAKR